MLLIIEKNPIYFYFVLSIINLLCSWLLPGYIHERRAFLDDPEGPLNIYFWLLWLIGLGTFFLQGYVCYKIIKTDLRYKILIAIILMTIAIYIFIDNGMYFWYHLIGDFYLV